MPLQPEIHSALEACSLILAHFDVGDDLPSHASTPNRIQQCYYLDFATMVVFLFFLLKPYASRRIVVNVKTHVFSTSNLRFLDYDFSLN